MAVWLVRAARTGARVLCVLHFCLQHCVRHCGDCWVGNPRSLKERVPVTLQLPLLRTVWVCVVVVCKKTW